MTEKKIQENALTELEATNHHPIPQPKAKQEAYEHNQHGETRADPYHWLRDDAWPNVKKTEVLDYLSAENKYSEEYFSHRQQQQKILLEELKARIEEESESYPIRDQGFLYFTRFQKGEEHKVYWRRPEKGTTSQEEMLLDLNALARGHESFSHAAWALDPKHTQLAYSIDLQGEERYTAYVKDLSRQTLHPQVVKDTSGQLVWHRKLPGFFYCKLDDKLRSNRIYFHAIDQDQRQDTLIYEEKDSTFYSYIFASADEHYLFIKVDSSEEDEVWGLDLTREQLKPQKLISRHQHWKFSLDRKEKQFFLVINDKGKNFRLARVDEQHVGDREKWQELIAHRDDVYLTDFAISRNHFMVEERIKGLENLFVYDKDLAHPKRIPLPEATYAVSADFPTYEATQLRLQYSSLTTPSSTYEYDYQAHKLHKRQTQKILGGFAAHHYKTERLFARAGDGVEIPISLVYRKDLFQQNGENPLYLTGYGSYGISYPADFHRNMISLLDRGFVFAIAHIRGGDDMGYLWYEKAKFLNKKKTFHDFVAVSEFLISEKYTHPKKLNIMGGSAGGMLMGVVINERPELYNAVVARVPFVDVLNTMLDESLPLTPGEFKEWGNPKNKEYYDYIRSYSPYDNVKTQPYPALFVTAGLTDPRVTYWEPAKWVAKLRNHSTSDRTLLLYTEMKSGHFGQSGRYQHLQETAKIFTFLLSENSKL